MTTYHEHDLASVDTHFSVHIHHPRFLECVGAPQSARLLGRPPVEWLQVMDRRDGLIAAVQLQWDTGLTASNRTVLNQYVVALHHMSMEVMQCVLSFASRRRRCAGAPHTSGISDGGHVPLASPVCPGRPRTRYSAPGRGLHRLSRLSSAAVRLAVRTGLTGLPPCTGLSWSLNCSNDCIYV